MFTAPPLATFIADVHVGNPRRFGGASSAGINVRGRAVVDALDRAVRRSEELGSPALVVLGDLFDRSATDPRLMAATMRALASEKVRVLVLVGNHDQVSTQPNDHALGPLAFVPNVVLVESPRKFNLPSGLELLLVPFEPGDARVYLPERLRALHDEAVARRRGASTYVPLVVAGFHAGIADDTTPVFLRDAPDALPAVDLLNVLHELNVRAAFAGNWHARRAWSRDGLDALQVGALVPTGFSNPGVDGYGTLAWIAQDRTVGWEVLGGPRFLDVRTAEEFREASRMGQRGARVYLRWHCDPDDLATVREALDEAIEAGHVVAGEAVVDTGEAVAATRTAAASARRAMSFDEALAGYIEAMPVQDGVDRGRVLDLARKYVRRAQGAE